MIVYLCLWLVYEGYVREPIRLGVFGNGYYQPQL